MLGQTCLIGMMHQISINKHVLINTWTVMAKQVRETRPRNMVDGRPYWY